METPNIAEGVNTMEPPNVAEGVNTSDNSEMSSANVEEMVPRAGMVFSSEEEVRNYYYKYSYQAGFGVRRFSVKGNAPGQRIYYALGCVKGGKYVSTSKNLLYSRATTKTGCKAKINVIVDSNGKCTISGVYLEHNHTLSPKKSRFQRSHKQIDAYSKRRLALNDQAGIPMNKNFQSLVVEAGGHENLSYEERDCRNFIAKVRRLRLGLGDAEALRDYFVCMQKRNANFFHVIDMDDDGRLRNVFWADARSRAAYESFGDVVSFDSTYLTNRYNMPFAPFVGVNHHGQSILFGCGLLSSEDTTTYTWLFESWLKCMRGRHPNAIITDQCRSIQAAVAKVFPKSHHRLCLWHIMKKLPEKFGGFSQYKPMKKRLKSIVYESLSPEEFDDGWSRMIADFELEESEWLNSLFLDRSRWAPAFVKKIFWAGMSTTQRSEGMNAFFDDYVNAKTSLKQFVEQYDNALKSKVEKEMKADYDSLNSSYTLITGYLFEKQFQEAYTNSIFKLFQDEIKGMLFCNFSLSKVEGAISIFTVIDILKGKDGYSEKRVQYSVWFNEHECDIRCTCQLFEFRGIICRHMVKILIEKKVNEIPSRFILARWRKDIKHRHYYVKNCYDDLQTSEQDMYFDKMCANFFRAAEIALSSPEKCEYFMKYIEEGEKKLKDDACWGAKKISSENQELHDGSKEKLLPPLQVRSKGRPPSKRMLSTVEKVSKKKTKKKINKSGEKANTTEQDGVRSSMAFEKVDLDNIYLGETCTPSIAANQPISRSPITQFQEVFPNTQTVTNKDMIWQNLPFTQLLQSHEGELVSSSSQYHLTNQSGIDPTSSGTYQQFKFY